MVWKLDHVAGADPLWKGDFLALPARRYLPFGRPICDRPYERRCQTWRWMSVEVPQTLRWLRGKRTTIPFAPVTANSFCLTSLFRGRAPYLEYHRVLPGC